MPKEVVDDAAGPFRVKVGWSKQGEYAQLATVAPGFPPVTEDSAPESNGWHVTLDRDSINRLIRLLRKARDQAFGADA